ncbi:hypothetical protein BH683_012665 [Williamsia sp. 1138]|uniref:FBP domain-containing protein n=1 Tax=Williamsia sp. 1138 TaxID=1903117 RepID=UPI000A10F1F9|nr:FBP domain-containing protein [Williamsia sp. 1138]OZG28605.1 hypothetical protein BH683_012665 [Williamsia sp. 1138]
MQHLTHQQIIDSFRGATRSEIKRVTLPTDFAETDFDALDFYGWRDRKIPRRGYICVPHQGDLVTLLLTQADAVPKRRAMCAWCRDVNLTSAAVMFSTRRAGQAGRRGDTIGVLACEDFSCPRNARRLPPAFHKATDLEALRAEAVAGLRQRVEAFVSNALTAEDV